MQYYGGKARIGKKISFYIQQQTGTIGTYIEPFCGMCSVGEEIKASRRIFSDNNEGVINLFNALKEGYNPPSFVTESEYKEIEQEYKQGCRSHKTIFVMIASSYSGRLCGGFARDKTGRNYTDAGSRSCIKKIKSLMDAEFFHREYTYYTPHNTRDVVIYADPPYSETKCYGKPFDNKKFWLWAEEMSRYNRVFVSEYKAPEGWECVLEFPTKSGMRDGDGNLRNIIEKLFEYRGE